MSERLPVVVRTPKGRMLIRGIPDHILCFFVRRLQEANKATMGFSWAFSQENGPLAAKAIALEVLSRPSIKGAPRHYAMALASIPCACGGPGFYIVGFHTFCRTCRPKAVARRQHVVRTLIDPHNAAVEVAKDVSDTKATARHLGKRGWK